MKLTKGRLMKLFDKKKQTKKNYKNNKSDKTEKTRTNKNRRGVNLHNTTLKHL